MGKALHKVKVNVNVNVKVGLDQRLIMLDGDRSE